MATNPFATVIAPPRLSAGRSGSNLGGGIRSAAENISNAFIARSTARKQEEQARAKAEVFQSGLQQLMPNLPPEQQEILRPFAENAALAAQLADNPQLLSNLGQGIESLSPTPEPREGDDILTLFGRGEQFAQQGDTRRAELMLSAAADKAGIDMSQQSGTPGPFGSGFKGSSYNLVNAMAPAAFTGELDDEQGRLLDSALAAVLQPVPVQNPITKETELVEPTIAPWMRQLAEQRGITAGTAQQPGTAPAAGAEGAAPQVGAEGAAPQVGAEGGEQQNIFAALPSGNSIVEQADNLAGPIDAAIRNLSSLTGLGGLVDEQVGAERLAADATELIVDALQTETSGTTRAVSERQRLRDTFGFTPEAFGNRQNIVERGAQGWLAMDQREQEILQRLANPGETTGEQKKRDRDALAKIRQAKPRVSPPVLQSAQEIQEFIASGAAGDRFVMRDPDDPNHPWITVEIEGSQ